jgi:FkbM family methyltransferase
MSDCFVRIKGDVAVSVPPALNRITTWVLLEQEDWFEKEIAFVRRWLRPGMRVVDIGANRGVYALTMAKRVAPEGRIWAFEPTTEAVAALARSAATNKLPNLQPIQMALGDQEGVAELHRNADSELNSLVHRYEQALESESVTVSTLDHQQAALHWGTIDFVKIDAEGMGLAILDGGARFFAEQSPLVMFEAGDAKAESDKTSLAAAFRVRGYRIYRLIGPDWLLAPVMPEQALTGFDLNLFAAKPDRSTALAAEGFLVERATPSDALALGDGNAFLSCQPYAAAFGSVALRQGSYQRALDAYALWRDKSAALEERYAALLLAFVAAREAVQERPSLARIVTLARIAFEAGERQFAVDLLPRAMPLLGGNATAPDEPLLPPLARFDAINPGPMARAWLLAAVFEAFETWQFFSSCFKPAAMQEQAMLDWFQASPFASAAMARRRQLQRWLAGVQRGLEASPLLAQATPDNLNPQLWGGKNSPFLG